MARLTRKQLEKVKEKYNVSTLWSWSKINTFMTSPYEFYLKYVLHKKEDIDNCAYAPLGSIAHSTLEKFYSDEIGYEDMIKEFDDGWITAIDIADLKFDRNDEIKNDSIKSKYKENLIHFFNNHKVIEHNVALEKFVAAKIGSNVLQGYIDAVFRDDDGIYHIIDWKTSSKYSGKALEEKSGQLTVYSIALIQNGVPVDKIKAGFNFLKYATIQYEQANGVIKSRDVERCKIGESLQSNAKMWLKKLGYEGESDDYLKMLIDTNSIEVLPEDVQAKYKISDCYVYIPLDQKLIDKWIDTITSTIQDIVLREKDYKKTKSDACFWDTDESVKKESYYFATLCGYSANLHKPYQKYLEKLDAKKNGDIFGNVGDVSKVICDSDDDLSWLNDI